MENRFRYKLAALVGVVSAAVLFGYQKPAVKQPVPAKPVVCEGPVSLEGVLNYLDDMKAEKVARKKPLLYHESHIISEVERCGIDFDVTPETLDSIRKKEGSVKLIALIEKAPKVNPKPEPTPTPPQTPPPPKQGQLSVACKPVDCVVSIDDAEKGTTKDKVLLLTLNEGTYKVAVAAAGYEPDRNAHTAVVAAGRTEPAEFKLKPSRAALEAAGQELFNQMIKALGGDAGLKEAARVHATDSQLICDMGDGKRTTWTLVAWIKLPGQGKFAVTRLGQQQDVFKTDSGFAPIPKEKGEELEEALRDFYDRQIGKMLERLVAPGLKKSATELAYGSGESPVLRVEGGADTYVVTLDAQFLPKEVKLESNGLTNGLRIQYADYEKTGPTFYPKYTQVMWPTKPARGMEMRIGNVEVGAVAVKETDLVPKGKVRKTK